MDTVKVPMEIDKDHLETAPDYIRQILDKEAKDNNILLHIEGESYCYPDGEDLYDLYTLVFASTMTGLNIYKVSKWVDMPPRINFVWLFKDEADKYFDLLKGVDWIGEITKRNGA